MYIAEAFYTFIAIFKVNNIHPSGIMHLREARSKKKIVKSPSYVRPLAGISVIWQDKQHVTALLTSIRYY